MILAPTIPPSVRQFLLDGLQLLIHRLAALTEEFRAGLIAAIGRTLADGTEHLMDRVIPQSGTLRVRPPEYRENTSIEPGSRFDDSRPEFPLPQDFHEAPSTDNPTPTPLTRALIAAGLNALGVWLLRVGLVPTSAVVAMLGGMILMFRQSK